MEGSWFTFPRSTDMKRVHVYARYSSYSTDIRRETRQFMRVLIFSLAFYSFSLLLRIFRFFFVNSRREYIRQGRGKRREAESRYR